VAASVRRLPGSAGEACERRENFSEAGFARSLEAARAEVVRVATVCSPPGKHAQNLAKRFHKHGEAYFQFITTPGIEPTNNLAEQAIRFVVIDRRITQGTRSETGRRWCEWIWTTIATCTQQRRSVFEFLWQTVESHIRGNSQPSFMPSDSPKSMRALPIDSKLSSTARSTPPHACRRNPLRTCNLGRHQIPFPKPVVVGSNPTGGTLSTIDVTQDAARHNHLQRLGFWA